MYSTILMILIIVYLGYCKRIFINLLNAEVEVDVIDSFINVSIALFFFPAFIIGFGYKYIFKRSK